MKICALTGVISRIFIPFQMMRIISNQLNQLKVNILQNVKAQLDPINTTLRSLSNKVDTQHEVMKNEVKKLEETLSQDIHNNHDNLAREVRTTGVQVERVIRDMRVLTNTEATSEEVANDGHDGGENIDPGVGLQEIQSPQFFRDRIMDQDPGKLDGYMRRQEIVFLLNNFDNSSLVHSDWIDLLKTCRDPITFLLVLFDEFTFNGKITSGTWTAPEHMDSDAGKSILFYNFDMMRKCV